MFLFREALLGIALMGGVSGTLLMTPTPAMAGEYTAYGHAFETPAEAEAYRVTYCPIAPGTPFPTYVKFKQTGPNGAGFYVCYTDPF